MSDVPVTSSETAASIPVCHVTTVHQVPDPRIFLKQCVTLSQAGYRVHVLTTGETARLEGGPLLPVRLGSRSLSRLRRLAFWPKIVRELRRIDPAIVHFHDPELLPLMYWLKTWVWPKKHFIYDIHESYRHLFDGYRFPWNQTARFYLELLHRAEKRMTFILAEDSYQREFSNAHPVVRNFPIYPEAPATTVRERVMIYVGAVEVARGSDVMINAFATLGATDWRLQIVGHTDSPAESARLEQLAVARSARPGQIEVHDFMPHPQAMALIRRARLGLCLLQPHPNYLGSLPTKVFEYLAAGVPVLLSGFPFYREFFAGVPGIRFVDPLDVAAVASAMAEFVDPANEPRLAEEAAAGARECRRRFSWETEGKTLTDLYARLLAPEIPKNRKADMPK